MFLKSKYWQTDIPFDNGEFWIMLIILDEYMYMYM